MSYMDLCVYPVLAVCQARARAEPCWICNTAAGGHLPEDTPTPCPCVLHVQPTAESGQHVLWGLIPVPLFQSWHRLGIGWEQDGVPGEFSGHSSQLGYG